MSALESVAKARALYYDFFAGLFLYELLHSRASLLLEQVRILKSNPFSESDSVHFALLESTLESSGVRDILEEYTRCFLLPFTPPSSSASMLERRKKRALSRDVSEDSKGAGGQIMLYLSHYKEGCLNGAALLRAKELVRQSSFRLNKEECKESEEHLGFLLLLMRHLLLSSDENDKILSVEVANELALPLGQYVSEALMQREDLRYYAGVGELLGGFLQVELALL